MTNQCKPITKSEMINEIHNRVRLTYCQLWKMNWDNLNKLYNGLPTKLNCRRKVKV